MTTMFIFAQILPENILFEEGRSKEKLLLPVAAVCVQLVISLVV